MEDNRWTYKILLLALILTLQIGYAPAQDEEPEIDLGQGPCNASKCLLPECACPSKSIPGGFEPAEIPQMILVMFDGRLAEGAENLINRLFPKDRQNPNKCPIVSTFFTSNENTDYCSVNRLWAEGHEIGVNGLTKHDISFWQEASADIWETEIKRQEENLGEKAGINVYALEGWRTPHLQPGGDTQYHALNIEFVYQYDSTLAVPVVKTNDTDTSGWWPFTLDYSFQAAFPEHYCYKCPEFGHKGLWEVPVVPLWDGRRNIPCNYLHACPTLMDDPVQTYNLLHNNFQKHYSTTRAPFTINVNPRWLTEHEEAAKGLENFIIDMVKEDDVWFVTGAQAVQWVRRPRSLGQLDSFTPWGCFARRYKPGCEPRSRNKTAVRLFPGLIQGGSSNLVLWQYLALTAAFLVLFQYDRRRKD